MVNKCFSDAAIATSEDCKNARQAVAIEDVGSFEDLPAMNLPAPMAGEAGGSESQD